MRRLTAAGVKHENDSALGERKDPHRRQPLIWKANSEPFNIISIDVARIRA